MARDLGAIYDALFARLEDLESIEYASRDWVDPATLAGLGRLPSLHLSTDGMHHENHPGMPPISTLQASLAIFVRQTTESEVTDTLLSISRDIKNALRRQAGEAGEYHTTLGGLVQWAWVTREEIAEGHVTGIAGMDVYIEMCAVEDS